MRFFSSKQSLKNHGALFNSSWKLLFYRPEWSNRFRISKLKFTSSKILKNLFSSQAFILKNTSTCLLYFSLCQQQSGATYMKFFCTLHNVFCGKSLFSSFQSVRARFSMKHGQRSPVSRFCFLEGRGFSKLQTQTTNKC